MLSFILGAMFISTAVAEEELQTLLDRLLAPPTIQVEAGFTAKVLVPPGEIYDPLWMRPQDDTVWVNDDGGEEVDKGSRILAISREGKVSVLLGLGKLLPVVGFDLAPQNFGEFGGQIFTLAQAKVALEGAVANHIIQRIDKDYNASVFCSLSEIGEGKVSGFGVEARFGPEGSPFAKKLFAITAFNNTIYQITSDAACKPFVTFDEKLYGTPIALRFTPDGKTMLVTVAKGDIGGPPVGKTGTIVRVSPDGKVDKEPLVKGLIRPMGMDFAPKEFGLYGGQLFVSDAESLQIPVPMTQSLAADGKVYRVTSDGKIHLVASGFLNPAGLHFIGDKLWVCDINGDFIAGKRELPDGFIVEIRSQ
jgi:hypothetical protein